MTIQAIPVCRTWRCGEDGDIYYAQARESIVDLMIWHQRCYHAGRPSTGHWQPWRVIRGQGGAAHATFLG